MHRTDKTNYVIERVAVSDIIFERFTNNSFLDLGISGNPKEHKMRKLVAESSRNFVIFGRCDSVPADCSFLDLNSARGLRKSKRIQSIFSLILAKISSFLEF